MKLGISYAETFKALSLFWELTCNLIMSSNMGHMLIAVFITEMVILHECLVIIIFQYLH